MRLWDLCLHIDGASRFQINGEVIIPDGYLLSLRVRPVHPFNFVNELGMLNYDSSRRSVGSIFII